MAPLSGGAKAPWLTGARRLPMRSRRAMSLVAAFAVEITMVAVAGIALYVYESGSEAHWCSVQQPIVNGQVVYACGIAQHAAGSGFFISLVAVLGALIAWAIVRLDSG